MWELDDARQEGEAEAGGDGGDCHDNEIADLDPEDWVHPDEALRTQSRVQLIRTAVVVATNRREQRQLRLWKTSGWRMSFRSRPG